ncbi:hypothetical protein GCM10010176_085020 [Nonomuraea spiralis]|nr:hypothetical protein GCM10010176_085020 [Nonomuraea spiralis]
MGISSGQATAAWALTGAGGAARAGIGTSAVDVSNRTTSGGKGVSRLGFFNTVQPPRGV